MNWYLECCCKTDVNVGTYNRLDAMLGSQAHELQIIIVFLCMCSRLVLPLQGEGE